MKTENEQQTKKMYLSEFTYFNGEYDILLYIVDINTENMLITLAVNNQGKISLIEYDLKRNKHDDLYFEFGITNEQIKIDDFEQEEKENLK